MKRILIAIAATLALSGCANNKTIVWDKPGGTQAEFDRDERECHAEGDKAAATADWRIHNVALVNRNVYTACMRGRGYISRN